MGTSALFLKDNPTLPDLQRYIAAMVKERGHNDQLTAKMLLLMEEVGELAKACRKTAGMRLADDAAMQNAAEEAADVLIVFLGVCNILGIDIEQAFRDKEEKNKQRIWK
jgi:NTP pyrophosphatase (non-canonical NTP hydrolase)